MSRIQHPARSKVFEKRVVRQTMKTIRSSPIGSFLFNSLRTLWIQVFGDLPLEIFLISGVIKGSDLTASLLFIGHEESAYQFTRLVYSRIEKMRSFGSLLPFQIDISHFPNADIVIIHANKRVLSKFEDKDFFLLPYTRFGLDLRMPLATLISRIEHGRKSAIRKIENLNFSYIVKRNDKQTLDSFYSKMYLPYAKERFGKAAITISYRRMKAIYDREGGILLVKHNDRTIWGNLFQIRGKTIYDRYLGSDMNAKATGEKIASHVTYLFLIRWAKTHNIMGYDGGIALPFFSDGIFKYKKGWGMFVRKMQYAPYWALKLNNLSEGGLSLLEKNPFIFMDHGKIKSVAFVRESLSDSEVEHLTSEFHIPQLDSSLVVAYHQSCTSDINGRPIANAQNRSKPVLPKPLSHICSLFLGQGIDFRIYEHK